MNPQQLQVFLATKFPDALAIALTGSQKNNIVFNNESDIDVLVFDAQASRIATVVCKTGEAYKIDILIIPAFDIENVIIDSFANSRHVLFHMLKDAHILFDTIGIVQEIINRIKVVPAYAGSKLQNRKQSIEKGLLLLAKYFKRDLQEDEKVLLLCEFITLISKIEVIDCAGNDADAMRKVNLLQAHNSGFVKELLPIFYKALASEQLGYLDAYICGYLNKLSTFEKELTPELTVDIRIESISPEKLFAIVFQIINSNIVLKKAYRYHFYSLKRYENLYKYDVCISFVLENKLTGLAFIQELLQGFRQAGYNSIDFNIIPTVKKFKSDELYNDIQTFRSALCNLSLTIVTNYNEEDAIPVKICLSLLKHIQELSLIDLEDSAALNDFLMQRWILSSEEQNETLKGAERKQLTGKKKKHWDGEYINNKENFLAIVSENINHSCFTSNEKIYNALVLVKEAIATLLLRKSYDWDTYYFPMFLINYIGVKQKIAGHKYLILVEEVFLMFYTTDEMKSECLYLLIKSDLDLFFVGQ